MDAHPALPAQTERARILVVEDEAIIAGDLARRLQARGYAVTAIAATGAAAVRSAAEDPPDLVLMDIVLPGDLDGIEAARIIVSRRDVPVIYVTAYADESVVGRALQSGPFGYVVKPFEDGELVRAIEIALRLHRLERRVRESEQWLATTLASIGEAVLATGTGGRITYLNPSAERLLGLTSVEAAGRPLPEILDLRAEPGGESAAETLAAAVRHEEGAKRLHGDFRLRPRAGREVAVTLSSAPIADREGRILGTVLAIRDVSAEKDAGRELQRHVEEVRERNTALKVLLEQRERDRVELEDRIMENLRYLVVPYLEKLAAAIHEPREEATLNVLRANLEQIVSPFSRRLTSRLHGLTPQELRIASLIRDGRRDKEIVELLNISFETVKSHRQNIRKKLGIYGTGSSLRSLLSHFSE